MNFHLRVDSTNAAHVRVTIFIDGGNCGQLTLRLKEYERLSRLLLLGGMKWGAGNTIQCDTYVIPPTLTDASGRWEVEK